MKHVNLSNKELNQITKESLETALLILLETKEFDQISITELTKKAGVSRPAFYRNYESKEEILKNITVPILEKISTLFSDTDCHRDPKHYIDFFTLLKKHQTSLKVYFSHLDKIPFSFFNENSGSLPIDEYYRYRIGTTIYFSIAKDWLDNNCQPNIKTMSRILQDSITKLFP